MILNKVTVNDYRLIRCLGELIPSPKTLDISQLLTDYCSNDFKTLFQGIVDNNYTDFLIQYISKSYSRKISSMVELLLETSPLTLYNNEFYSINEENIPYLFHIIESRFSTKWTKQLATLGFEYNPIKPYDMVLNEDKTDSLTSETTNVSTVESTSNNINENHITNDESSNSVFGFNSSSSVPSDESNHTLDGHSSGNIIDNSTKNDSSNYSRSNPLTRLITRNGNIGNIPQQDLVMKERGIWEYQMWDILFKDLDSVLTRAKYI